MKERWILIVEDQVDYAQVLCAKVTLLGCNPLTAPTMAAAIVTLKSNPIETCILDLHLPDSDTIHTLSRIPLIKSLGVAKVGVLTGAVLTEEIVNLALVSGADAVLSKDDRELIHQLKALVLH